MTPIEDSKIIETAIKSATNYINLKCKDFSMEEKQNIMNACAAAFYMGARWAEQEHSIKEEK